MFPEGWMTSGNISRDSMAPYLSCFSQLNISPLFSQCHQEASTLVQYKGHKSWSKFYASSVGHGNHLGTHLAHRAQP